MKSKILLVGLLFACISLSAQTSLEKGLKSINRTSAEAAIGFLASDQLEGRESGLRGAHVSAEYLASLLQWIGVQPLGKSYLQSFDASRKDRWRPGRFEFHPDSIAKLKQGVHIKVAMNNVLGMIPGKNTKEYVVVGAHLDHIGIDTAIEGDQIYNGADDNASGVSAVLQIARAFVTSGQQPERNVIFAFWDGEEKGLVGSRYFVRNCSFASQIKGCLNLDMIGRNNRPEQPQHVAYFYSAEHPVFGNWLKEDIVKYNLKLAPVYNAMRYPVRNTDSGSFAEINTPVIWYHTDGHPDYHQPTDHADRLNWDKIVEITKSAFLNMWKMANEQTY